MQIYNLTVVNQHIKKQSFSIIAEAFIFNVLLFKKKTKNVIINESETDVYVTFIFSTSDDLIYRISAAKRNNRCNKNSLLVS